MLPKFIRSLLIVFAAAIPFSAPRAVANLVANPGFEDGFTDWFAYEIGLDSANPHSGNFNARTTVFSGATLSQTLTTAPGDFYTLSFWIMNEHHEFGTENYLTAAFNGATVFSLIDFPPTDPDWLEFTVIDLQAVGPLTSLEFTFGNVPGAWDIDDISVVSQGGHTIPESGDAALLFAIAFGVLLLVWQRTSKRSSVHFADSVAVGPSAAAAEVDDQKAE